MLRRLYRATAIICGLALISAQTTPALAQEGGGAPRQADALIATAEALEALAQSVDRTSFDVRDLSVSLGEATPEMLMDWVASNTRLVAYRGTLKGAGGTLEDRAGNSLDRALLLAALVQARGIEARLARAELTQEAAAAMARLAETPRVPAPAMDETAGMALVEKLKDDPRIDGARYRAFTEVETARMAAIKAKGEAMTAALTAALSPALPGGDETALATDAAAALSDHWWVQANIGGAWVDLDPAAAGATASATLTAEDIREDLKHKVTLRVVAEVAREGALSSETLLETTIVAAEAQGDLISIIHRAGGPAATDEEDGSDAALFAAGAGAKVWEPVILLDRPAKSRLVAASGETAEANEANFSKFAGTSAYDNAAAAIDAIGPEEEPEAPGVFTAEWLEVEVASPGAAARIERRIVFDAIGHAARASGRFEGELSEAARTERGLALMDEIDLIVMTGAMSKDRAARRTAALVAIGMRAAATVVAAEGEPPVPDAPDGYRRPAPALSEFAATRFGLAPDAGAEIVSPNVALMRSGTRAEDGATVEATVFDIVVNAVTGTPHGAMAAGIADTVSEHMVLGAPDRTNNTAARHAADLAAGKGWSTLASEADLAALGADETATAVLAAELQRGFMVIAPAAGSGADLTWWRVDPRTGETLGMTTAGGSETSEYVVLVSFVFGWGACMQKHRNAQKAAGGWKKMARPKRLAVLACYGGALVGTYLQSATALGLIVGGVGTIADEL